MKIAEARARVDDAPDQQRFHYAVSIIDGRLAASAKRVPVKRAETVDESA